MLTHPWWLTSERNEPPRSQHLWPPDVTYRSWGIPEVDVESGPWTGLILKHFPSSTSARMPLWTEGNNKDYSRSTSTTKSSSANAAPFGENSLWKLWPRERRMLPKARIWNPSARCQPITPLDSPLVPFFVAVSHSWSQGKRPWVKGVDGWPGCDRLRPTTSKLKSFLEVVVTLSLVSLSLTL